ncbi:MAG: hypothetical protein BWY65_01506 [Firmicutes bacterium ADurb.Bin373]|nr:MAG: hypothetical protein BWY65_01506 [Firmicutes bacterium ADurb.Bin373]
MIITAQYFHRPVTVDEDDALIKRLLYLPFMGGHLVAKFQADCFYLCGAEAHGCAGYIHGHVAAADHQDAAADCLLLSYIGFMQKGQGHDYAWTAGARQGQAFAAGKADAYDQGVILVSEPGDGYVFPDLNPGTNFDSGCQYLICISFEHLPGQAVHRQRSQKMPAQAVVFFVNYHSVSLPGQIIGGSKPAGTRSHDGHLFACFVDRRGVPVIRGACGFHSKPFQIAYGQGAVDSGPPAAVFAGMGAHPGAYRGKGVVGADQAAGFRIILPGNCGQIAPHICVYWTSVGAWRYIFAHLVTSKQLIPHGRYIYLLRKGQALYR